MAELDVTEQQEPVKKLSAKRSRALNTEVRFEFAIPDQVPQDKSDRYVWEKMKRMCRGLSKNGIKVTPVVPAEFAGDL